MIIMNSTRNYQKHVSKNPLQKFLIENFYTTLLESLQGIKLKSILDAGCGEGFTLAKLQQNKIAQHLEGIDISRDAIRLGKSMYPSISFKLGSIYKLPYKDNSFDLVLCCEVLEHLEDPHKALQELIRVSKKYCLLTVPNEPLFMISNFLRGKNWSRWGNDIEHINHWSKNGFEKLVRKKQLKLLVTKTPFPWTLVLGQKIRGK